MTERTDSLPSDEAAADGSGNTFTLTSNALEGRELEWAINTQEQINEHKKINTTNDGKQQQIIRTRFPPEPNGYLHIGHAKSMNMNFSLAFDKLGVPNDNRRTIFRYDDTNPDAESKEYIDSLRRDLDWLGWKPECTTYSSDNFQTLYEYAIILIKKGLAYVCDMTKIEMEQQRDLALRRVKAKQAGKDPDVEAPIPSSDILPGRNRNTSIEHNLMMFDKMKMGMFDEGTYTLRLKMDFTSPNPNMYDLVAYRIKYTSHPHAGNGWCIYPSYDFTHGSCDSIEHIDYSICTLEFETRREPYYWILYSLDLYKPKVYEMSRLNLQYTVLSKRRLLKLVTSKTVRSWSDPRMPTISGLRRRGYTPTIINTFCNNIGATRAQNVIEMNKLDQCARQYLSTSCIRAMACLDPIKVTITNYDTEKSTKEDNMTFDVQNIATDDNGGSHKITLTSIIYIDSSDFRLQDSSTYYGLAPNKAVGLKYYGGNLICNEVIKDDSGDKVIELKCTIDNSDTKIKPKTYISWVPANGIKCEVRVYNHLFVVPEPTDTWEDEINPESEIVYDNSIVDPSIKDMCDVKHIDKWQCNFTCQFERMGYYVIDSEDTTYNSITNDGKLVFNRTVSLKEDVVKKQLSKEQENELEARKLKQKKDLQDKERRMKIDPINLFKEGEEYVGKYSMYDEKTGIPTHYVDGEEIKKSQMKKLEKEKQKHIKQQMKWKQSQEKKK